MNLKILLTITIFLVKNSFSLLESNTWNDNNCETQLNLFSDALNNRELWALKFFDFWSKFHSGYLVGATYDFGHYVDCVSFRHVAPNNEINNIQGQHCLITFRAVKLDDKRANNIEFNMREIGEFARNSSLTLVNGACLPASCTPMKVIEFVNEKFLLQADLEAISAQCKTKIPLSFTALDIFATTIFAIILLVALGSTIYDIMAKINEFQPNKLYIAFSLYTNGQKLFDVTKSKSPNSINCLHGIRSLSILWIIFGHRCLNHLRLPNTNPENVIWHQSHIHSVIYFAYENAVDTFLVMGAMLMTISTLNSIYKKKLNIPRMIWCRYLRYTPPLAALLLFTVTLYKFFLDGPWIDHNVEIIRRCKAFWFSTIFHFQNYFNPNELCLSHTWYLTMDFQLYIISPFLIYPATKYGWKYLCLIPGLALFSSIYTVLAAFTHETELSSGAGWYRILYYPTHVRMGPWMFGILLGYISYTYKSKTVNISKRLNSFLWITSLSFITFSVVSYLPFYTPGRESPVALHALQFTLGRALWAIGVCWIIFACQMLKTGGIIRWFLTIPQWQPIGKMGLSIYIIHCFYQKTIIFNQKQTIRFDLWEMMHIYWGDILASLAFATIIYLLFEAPFILVENYFYQKYSERKQTKLPSTVK